MQCVAWRLDSVIYIACAFADKLAGKPLTCVRHCLEDAPMCLVTYVACNKTTKLPVCLISTTYCNFTNLHICYLYMVTYIVCNRLFCQYQKLTEMAGERDRT